MEIKKRIELISLLPPNPVGCELGCAEGLFSRDLLVAGFSTLYMVDVWNHIPNVKGDANSPQQWHDANFENVKKLVAPFGDKAVILRGLTTEMAGFVPYSSLDLLYLDAGHLKEEVAADLDTWFPSVKIGGVIAMHDYLMPEYGVREAAEEFCKQYGFEIHIIPETELKDAGAYFIVTRYDKV